MVVKRLHVYRQVTHIRARVGSLLTQTVMASVRLRHHHQFHNVMFVIVDVVKFHQLVQNHHVRRQHMRMQIVKISVVVRPRHQQQSQMVRHVRLIKNVHLGGAISMHQVGQVSQRLIHVPLQLVSYNLRHVQRTKNA